MWTVAALSNVTCDGTRTGVSDLCNMTGTGRLGDKDRPTDQALSGGAEPVRPGSHIMLGWLEFAPWNMAGGVVAVGCMHCTCGVH